MKLKYLLGVIANRLHFPFGKTTQNQILVGQTVVLDWNKIVNTKLEECNVVFLGLGKVHLQDSNLKNCTYTFTGPAGRTLDMLRLLNHANPELVQKTFGWRK